ncbi:interleukin 19 like [Pangasianodon hypophthalmus]|uniref:interleukin 19 like n=1 Tax=Pangasianodon hypophthalmus TaxID=310915 RepID=UPI0023072309|nr:interleukin 19 like [Pangasianodon hypophthalmus]
MKTSLMCILAICALLAGIWGSARGRRLHLGSCTLTVHTHELRHHFQQIRHNMVTQDNHKGVRLLRGDMMKSLQATDSCCFLRQLLRFYIEKVFSGYTSSQLLHQRTTSVLANSFLSMTKDLRACHAQMLCQCSQEANLKFDAIQETYDKLEVGPASVKAIGELDSLLEWLESFHSKDHKLQPHDDDSK